MMGLQLHIDMPSYYSLYTQHKDATDIAAMSRRPPTHMGSSNQVKPWQALRPGPKNRRLLKSLPSPKTGTVCDMSSPHCTSTTTRRSMRSNSIWKSTMASSHRASPFDLDVTSKFLTVPQYYDVQEKTGRMECFQELTLQ